MKRHSARTKKWLFSCIQTLLLVPLTTFAFEEGTRHITGSGVDLYFMNDKIFGSFKGHPLWALYKCGSGIHGEIDIRGSHREFSFSSRGTGMMTGTFGPLNMSLGEVEKKGDRFLYRVFMGQTGYAFSVRFEKIQEKHLVNTLIEGPLTDAGEVKLTVHGGLCPSAATGIIMIVAGAWALM